jgi:hypothetical protein
MGAVADPGDHNHGLVLCTAGNGEAASDRPALDLDREA